MQALSDSADDAIQTIDKLTDLHSKSIASFDDLSKRQKANVLKVFGYIETNPIIDIQKTATALELSYNAVSKIVTFLTDNGILQQTGKAKIFSYTEYLDFLRNDT